MLKRDKISLVFIGFVLVCIFVMGNVSAADVGNNTTDNATNSSNSTGFADSDWPSFQNNNNHTGQSDYKGPQTNTTKWTYNNITVYGSAVIGTNGTIYIGGDDGILYVFNSNGILQWTYTTRSNILGSPTIGSDGTIYISNWMNSTTYAISPNGTLKWKYTTGDYNYGSPVIGSDGTIYITVTNDINGTLYALYPTGKLKWTYSMGILHGSSPVIGSNGTIYIVDYDGVMYAINPDGTKKWSYTITYSIGNNHYYNLNFFYDTPSIGSDGTIYIANNGASYDGKSRNIFGLFAISDNGTYGTLKWWYEIGEKLYGAPAISSNGTIYVVSASQLYAIDSNGNKLWNQNIGDAVGDSVTSAAIGSDGTIYVGSSTGFYALNPDGTLKWSYATGAIAGSPAISNDGTLYIGTITGTFYAFNDIAANFTAENINKTTVKFNGNTTGTPASWKWDFGDGTTSTLQNPTHTYSKAGNYKVILTVTLKNDIVVTRTKTVTIEKIDVTAPTANANLTGGIYNTTETVTLTATDDSNNTTTYYTTDGSNPKNSSTRKIYTNPIVISDTTTLKYIAVDNSDNWSPTYTKTYTIINTIYIQDASYYNNETINDNIQAIINNAAPGSIIIFLGHSYENLKLVINKNLNIISNVGTKILTKSSSGSAVFLINGTQASGTLISGFTIITSTSSGILVSNTSNVTISGVNVSSTDGTGVTVNGSSNTTIKNSSLNDSSNIGIYIFNSTNTKILGNNIINNENKGIMIDNSTNTTVKNSIIESNGNNSSTVTEDGGVYVQNSDQVQISNNQIIGNFFGISTGNVSNVTINSNIISDNFVDGIYLSRYVKNITIKANTIQSNANGIEIDYSSGGNISISGNDISDSVQKDGINIYSDYGGYTSGDGITFGVHYDTESIATDESIEHNAIYMNDYRDLDAHDQTIYGQGELPVGSNVYTYDVVGDNPTEHKFCCNIKTNPAQLVIERIGENTFTAYFLDSNTNEIMTDLPSIPITITLNGVTYTIMTVNGKATLNVPISDLINSITGSFHYNENSASALAGSFASKTDIGFASKTGSGTSNGGSGTGSGGNSGSASGSGSSGSSSSSGASSGSAATVGLLTALSTAGASGSSSSAGSNGKTVQELTINSTFENPNIWGIIGIIVLIIVVILAYYRKAIKNMIEKSKK